METVLQSRKECFGTLDRVFPVGESGMREVMSGCFECDDKVECLRTALATSEGFEFREDLLEKRSVGGFIGALRRWSEKKTLNRLMEKERKNKR